MGAFTNIQWCDSTCNCVMGCSGCELYPSKIAGGPCYAGCDHERKAMINTGFAPDFLLPTLFPGRMSKAARLSPLDGEKRLEKPWLDGLPRLVFVSDMGDALSDRPFSDKSAAGRHVLASDVVVIERKKGKNGRLYPSKREARPGAIRTGGVPFAFLKEEIIDVAQTPEGRRHHWLWLTKLPGRMAEFSRWLQTEHGLAWPTNVWAGTSVTSSKTLFRAKELLGVGDEKTLRFLSAEPLWDEVDLSGLLAREKIRWVIAGGESKQSGGCHHHRVRLEWLRHLRDQCAANGVPFFLKQLGFQPEAAGATVPLKLDMWHGGNWAEWPVDLQLREMPKP